MCGTTELSFTQKPNLSYTNIVGIDPLPAPWNVLTHQVTRCESEVKFTLTPSVSFISLNTTGINSASITMHPIPLGTFGTYDLTLKARVDA